MEQAQRNPYYGEHITVRNSIEGIGIPYSDYGSWFGSKERLQGSVHLASISTIPGGPSLHELFHQWGNDALPTASPYHWGFSSVGGQLGGFGSGELVDLGGGDYTATLNGGPFGTYANSGNDIGYAPLELYLMGLIPADEVPAITFAPDGTWIADQQFHTDMLQVVNMDEFIAEYGPRVPGVGEAQTEFRALFIAVCSGDELDVFDFETGSDWWGHFDRAVEDFTRTGPSLLYPDVMNYWEATGGRATLDAGSLHESLRPNSSPAALVEARALTPEQLARLPVHR